MKFYLGLRWQLASEAPRTFWPTLFDVLVLNLLFAAAAGASLAQLLDPNTLLAPLFCQLASSAPGRCDSYLPRGAQSSTPPFASASAADDAAGHEAGVAGLFAALCIGTGPGSQAREVPAASHWEGRLLPQLRKLRGGWGMCGPSLRVLLCSPHRGHALQRLDLGLGSGVWVYGTEGEGVRIDGSWG